MVSFFDKAIARWVAFLLFPLTGCGATHGPSPRQAEPGASNTLPAVVMRMERENLAGEKTLLEAYRGKVVAITYFATWCVPCKRLVSVVDRLAHGKQAVPGFVSLPISVDRRPKSVLPDFVQSQRLKGTIALGNRAERRGRTPFGRIKGLPTTFLIDPKGVPIEKLVGEIPAAYLRRRIASLREEHK